MSIGSIPIPAGELPVLFDADTAIIGGSLAGIAAAVALAERGRRAVVIESRSYMGREMTATLRSWLHGAGLEDWPEEMRACLRSAGGFGEGSVASGYVPLHPDGLKRGLEDLLMERGIPFIYATAAVGFLERDGRARGLIVANKSGRQAVRCSSVIDATETGIAASLLGQPLSAYAAGDHGLYKRTLEFTGVAEMSAAIDGSDLKVPARLGLWGDRIALRPGCLGDGHLFAEFCLKLKSGNDRQSDRIREVEARRKGMELAVWLIGNMPAFSDAHFAASSHELLGPFPLSAGEDGGSRDYGKDDPFTDAASFETRLGNVLVAAQGLYRQGDTSLLDPARSAWLGQRLAAIVAVRAETVAGTRGDAGMPIGATEQRDAELTGQAGHEAFEAATVQVRSPVLLEVAAGDAAWVPSQPLPVWKRTGVLVVGGGTSGACASFTAAREGADTTLLELNPGLGGTGTLGGVDSYWFGRRTGFAARISDRVHEVQSRLKYRGHKWNIEAKMFALLQEACDAGVDLALGVITFGALADGRRVCGAVAATRWGPCAVLADAVIDATGDGDIAAYAGAEFVYGSERDSSVMWYSLAQFKSPGKTQNNFTSMVEVSNALDYTRAIIAGRRRGDGCYDHGVYIATRESRHVVGDVTMTLSDQLLQRSWPDTVNIHFSNHDVKGVSEADWVPIGLIPPNLEIEIPYRMLLPKGIDGLLVVGKAISATHDALPAIRMQSDLENLGAVAAIAAAAAVRSGTRPRDIDVRALQTRAAREGLIPKGAEARTLAPIRYTDEQMAALVDRIEAEFPLYDYANMRMNETYRGTIPFVEICCAGSRIVPHLERAIEGAEGMRRIRLAQALAMIGSEKAVPVLVGELMRMLEGDALPVRTADMMYVQLPPDHGAMPDAAYLLYSLAQVPTPDALPVWSRVASLLHPTEDDFKDTWQGLYYYVDGVCRGAERFGGRAAAPILEQLHRIPSLCNLVCRDGAQPDYFLERRAMLELAIGRALARCGSDAGYRILIAYLADVRSLLAKGARTELRRIAGQDFGPIPEAWERWLREQRPDRQTFPLPRLPLFSDNGEAVLRRA